MCHGAGKVFPGWELVLEVPQCLYSSGQAVALLTEEASQA